MGRYIYKGADIERHARRNLRVLNLDQDYNLNAILEDPGQGELALCLALLNPEHKVRCRLKNQDSQELLRGAACEFVNNLEILQ